LNGAQQFDVPFHHRILYAFLKQPRRILYRFPFCFPVYVKQFPVYFRAVAGILSRKGKPFRVFSFLFRVRYLASFVVSLVSFWY
jgi:hypothetical protein